MSVRLTIRMVIEVKEGVVGLPKFYDDVLETSDCHGFCDPRGFCHG